MTLQPCIQSQYRTLHYCYSFQVQNSQTLVVKVYDTAQQCFSKKIVSATELAVWTVNSTLNNPFALWNTLLQKKLLLEEKLPSTLFIFQDCLKELQKLITHTKSKCFSLNKYPPMFTCPLTRKIFNDPVMDNHGHTFEKDAIEKHLTTSVLCPVNGQSIERLSSTHIFKYLIQSVQAQESIPNFDLFKEQNSQLATSYLKMAQKHVDTGEYNNALSAYSRAFQYTQKWPDYQQLPALFEKMGNKDKAHLAYLYLIQYQIQADAISDVLHTLEERRKNDPDFPLTAYLLFQLYHCHQQPQKALNLILDAGDTFLKEHPQEALHIYQQIIIQDPTRFEAYYPLASLLKDPREKAYLFLKGACHAIQQKKYDFVTNFCQEAKKLYNDSFLDKLVELGFCSKQEKSDYKKRTQLTKTQKQKKPFALDFHVYRRLAHLYYDPTYYEKIMPTYQQLKQILEASQRTLQYLDPLIKKQGYEQAEKYSLQALEQTPSDFYLKETQKIIYAHLNSSKQWGFGKAEWAQHFGNIGDEPPLPSDIEKILNSPCSFYPDKTVGETHLLFLIPKTVNGKLLTLKTLGELVSNLRKGNSTQYDYFNIGGYKDVSAESHWVLITRDLIPDSRGKNYAHQQELFKNYPNYQMPTIRDIAIAIFVEFVKTGNCIYRRDPLTYSFCQEQYDEERSLVIGGFGSNGLRISYCPKDGKYHTTMAMCVGVGGVRKL